MWFIGDKQVPYRTFTCTGCGRRFALHPGERRKKRCVECGMAEFVKNAEQLHAKSGPHYERWLAGCMGTSKSTP